MKKLKVFNHPWHLAHQYELMKFEWIDWSWLIQFHRQYNDTPRGDFFKGEYVVDYEKGKYDFALLHIDQQCLDKALMERGKGSLYRELNEVITDIPKVVIMHGTPDYPERFEDKQILIDKAKELLEGCHIIVNSKTAAKQWGFGTPIWHGMDPDEWLDLEKEPRVITMIGPAGLDHYYDRAFLKAVKENLLEEGINHCHITVDWSANNWQEYKEMLGRSLLYFNPTLESPMPRARTEAMLSGCCVLTTPHQDADQFIENGKNGFIIPREPQQVVELIKELMSDYEGTKKIGQAGKQTALKTFSKERFEQDWKNFLLKELKINV
jgi:glycosyltransferase involved in cell wall biosynthesis